MLLTGSITGFDEDENPFKHLSLHETRLLCEKHGLRFNPTARKVELETLLRGAAISYEFDATQRVEAQRQLQINKPTNAEIEAVENEMRETLAAMEPFEFIAWCKSEGITVSGPTNKEKRNTIIDEYIDSLKA